MVKFESLVKNCLIFIWWNVNIFDYKHLTINVSVHWTNNKTHYFSKYEWSGGDNLEENPKELDIRLMLPSLIS
jgi:hypothetical protein